MTLWPTSWFGELPKLVRYYQAALFNTAFGYALYALLVALGLNRFAAQTIAHFCGVGFNYFTYSRHAFRSTDQAKVRFIAAYVANYFVGLSFLAVFSTFWTSPYLAGLAATLAASVVNYFVLNGMVFKQGPA
jgi:putative flippase GtrA